jgi:hypothetical protein
MDWERIILNLKKSKGSLAWQRSHLRFEERLEGFTIWQNSYRVYNFGILNKIFTNVQLGIYEQSYIFTIT